MTARTRSIIQLNTAVLIWGGTAMFAKGIALPVTHIICIRSLVAAGALLLFTLAVRNPVRLPSVRSAGLMALLGVLLCLHWITLFLALRYSSAAVAILSLHTYPVVTALVEPFLFREQLKKTDVVLALVLFSGVLVMTPAISLANSVTRGIVLGIVSGLLFMARNLITRKYVGQYSGSVLMFWQALVTGLVLIPFLFTGPAVPSPGVWGLLVLLGVVFTAVPQTLFSASLQYLSAKTVGILSTLLPFYGAVLGYFIHREGISVRTAAGGGIILACVVFEMLKASRQTDAPGKDR